MKNHHHTDPLHPTSREAMHTAIAQLAYALWLKHGRPDGEAQAHWLEAERGFVAARQGKEPALPQAVDF